MRRYIGYREFVQRDQRSLVGLALLLTGSHEQAIRLALRAFHTVGLNWPPPLWENPTTHAQIALYRRFLQRPSSAGSTALVRLPPRQRVLVVACLHDGRSRGEMATLLSLPLATVEAEITEAVSTLTKGNEGRLVARLATAAGEASVPDLTARAMRTLRRRRNRGALLTTAAALIPISLIAGFILFQSGEVWWNSALGEQNHPLSTRDPEIMQVIPAPTEAAGPQPWRAPKTSAVIRYAVPGRCPGEVLPAADDSATASAVEITCAGWTLNLISSGDTDDSSPDAKACEGQDRCESTVNVPDAAQQLANGAAGDDPQLDPTISLDGRRIAYLSAAERRYVAYDLRSGMKRYLSPVLVPADTENGTLVSVSADGRHFTVTLGKRQLRTDFLTGALTPLPAQQVSAAEKTSDWLRRQYPVWKDAPSGRFSAAVGTEKVSPGKPQSLHIINTASRKVIKRLPLPSPGEPARAEVVSWLNNREVVVKMLDKTGSDLLGFFRVDAITGQTHRVAGLPDNDPIVLGAGTAL
ncbi:hypothetical protein [Streptosporangium sp. 'caverna']|uniref:hypothetical protein n=1 Tax=Streptosporangium sp. 'caverna' TaxID=2202249 RepID=UPI000D7DC0F3|nr:hypothetical protein [Streptosporangium sp. 'caverna']AWS40710.1 hypothetical protein DKM19_04465 [Streptosporangium sp. 'caverna']